MAPLKVGDKFPADVKFEWAPITDPDPTTCGIPQEYDASKEFAGKKVVLVSVPGAFTPSCSAYHIPPYIAQIDKLTAKGVDFVVVIASNDSWVMNAWGKVNGVKGDSKIMFMSDTKSVFYKNHGWDAGPGRADRSHRWVMVIERDGTVSVADVEKTTKDVDVTSVEAVLTKLSG
ncbi:peroxisomal matrix protein [Zymoseptoria brevis]|uniref:Peroxisomal matrix protein n=1 Tax=Zymoseptoria brevis TaxID=1047168 RepID=A0A0F4GEB8_9PEZI|nr:peroxisomal matrix protein [Zymoseptoria brevis]